MDATGGMTDVFNFFVDVFTWSFSFLDSFQFWGVSLLDIIITLFVISAALPIILAIISTRPVEVYNVSRGAVSRGSSAYNKSKNKFDDAFYSWSTRHMNDEWD